MMLMCKQVSHLVSEGMDRQLNFGERVGMNTHLMMCSGCRNFVAQMKLVREALHRHRDTPPATEPPKEK